MPDPNERESGVNIDPKKDDDFSTPQFPEDDFSEGDIEAELDE